MCESESWRGGGDSGSTCGYMYAEPGTTRIACFLWYPVAFWGYFAVFRGGYYKKSRFCVVPAVMGVFSLCKACVKGGESFKEKEII